MEPAPQGSTNAPDAGVGAEDGFLGVSRSLSGRAWRARPCDERLAAAISQGHGLPEIVGRILAGRDVSPDAVERYLDPSLKYDLPDPLELTDMDVAAERVAAAIMDGEDAAVFGDYDVDGATSAALLLRFFRAAGGRLRPYIPDRILEGYGPNAEALLKLGSEGASLVITVDCGTLSFVPLQAAAEAGLDVVVVDHHKAETTHPKVLALVNPNRLDGPGRHGQLAAVGVAFLLVVAANRVLREKGWYGASRPEPDLRQWLDLVALGTVCDVVPLTGVNRALVVQGLKIMARRGNVGLRALADVAGIDDTPGVYHAGFVLGPRVNAGGRVGESDLGTRLLSTEDEAEAADIAARLDAYNRERRDIEAQVQEEAIHAVETMIGIDGTPGPVVVAAGHGWHPGVIGIVASRLKERYGRPAVVIGIDGELAKGSGRSINGVDIGSAMIEALHRGLLINGGGHAMAAGLTMEAARLGEFETFLAERLAAEVAKAMTNSALMIDALVGLGEATGELVDAVAAAGPFGAGNREPRFALTGLRVLNADVVGGSHVRAILGNSGGGRIKAIAFRQADQSLGGGLLNAIGRKVHVAGRLKRDDWTGGDAVELLLEDAAIAD